MKKVDNPWVSLPPPLIYGLFFGISLLLQELFPLDEGFFNTNVSEVIGFLFLALR